MHFYADVFLPTLKLAALLGLLSLGFNLIYGVLRFINLAHGEVVVLGALLVERLSRSIGFPYALLLGSALAATAGIVLGRGIFIPLRQQARSAMLASSLGLAIVFQAVFFAFTKQASVSIRPLPSELDWRGAGFLLSALLTITLALELWLRKSRMGQAALMISESPILAEGWGIPVSRVYSYIFALAFGLATAAGSLLAANYSLSFGFSFRVLVWSFSAILLGGLGSILGGVLASLPVALLWSTLGRLGLEPFVDPLLLIICSLFYLLLPEGILGKAKRLV